MSGLLRLVLGTVMAGVLVAGLLLPIGLGIGLATNRVSQAVASANLDTLDEPVPMRTTITDAAGTPIAYVYQQNRDVVPYTEISQYLKDGVVAIEDRRFYAHHGVDWRGTVRALLHNSQSDGALQGGSTIDQQYVKNYLYMVAATTEAQKLDAVADTPLRKLREAKMALKLDKKYSKAQILDMYLNLVAFGPSTYGAQAASQRFFGVDADKLTLAQAALLAGMVNNPNKYNPLNPDHAEDALKRRNVVLDAMAQLGVISQKTADETKKQGLGVAGHSLPNGCINAPDSQVDGYFCQYVLDYLANAGYDADQIARGGYTIKTTLDPKVMADAKASLDENTDPNNASLKRIANVIAVVQPGASSRKVLALAANRPYGLDAGKGQTVQKLATTFAPLGAGSTFKIFTTAAAMEKGLGTNWTLAVPPVYVSPLAPAHKIHNAGAYPAQLTVGQALATSPNTPFVALEDQVGLQSVVNMAVALGMKSYQLPAGEVDRAFAGTGNTYAQEVVAQKIASFTLGVSPVSPLELSNVGATLDSDGRWCPPTPVDSITDRDGKLLTWKQAPCDQAVPAALAHTLATALGGDSQPGGTSYKSAQTAGWTHTVASKTGTTQDYKSSAFLGFTPSYSASVIMWDYLPRPESICVNPLRSCTTDQAQSGQGMYGGSVPGLTWYDTMVPLHKDLPNQLFPPPTPQYMQGAQSSQVPNVIGQQVDQAKQTLSAQGFNATTTLDYSSGAPANTVVDQNPRNTALPGSTIVLSVSTGGTTTGGGAPAGPGG